MSNKLHIKNGLGYDRLGYFFIKENKALLGCQANTSGVKWIEICAIL